MPRCVCSSMQPPLPTSTLWPQLPLHLLVQSVLCHPRSARSVGFTMRSPQSGVCGGHPVKFVLIALLCAACQGRASLSCAPCHLLLPSHHMMCLPSVCKNVSRTHSASQERSGTSAGCGCTNLSADLMSCWAVPSVSDHARWWSLHWSIIVACPVRL